MAVVDGTDDRLAASVNLDVLDSDSLFTSTPVAHQSVHLLREGAQQRCCSLHPDSDAVHALLR